MVLSAANRVGATRFIDSHTRQVVEVDHSERVRSTRPWPWTPCTTAHSCCRWVKKCVPGSASDVGDEMDASLEEHRCAAPETVCRGPPRALSHAVMPRRKALLAAAKAYVDDKYGKAAR